MSEGLQYSLCVRPVRNSSSDAPSTETIKSEETGQKPTDMAYVAGILDGEGCFRWHNSPCIGVDTTSKETAQTLYDLCGGSCSVLKRKTNANKTVFRWTIYGANAVNLCRLIGPYLTEKKMQAELLISLVKYPPNSAMRNSIRDRLDRLKR